MKATDTALLGHLQEEGTTYLRCQNEEEQTDADNHVDSHDQYEDDDDDDNDHDDDNGNMFAVLLLWQIYGPHPLESSYRCLIIIIIIIIITIVIIIITGPWPACLIPYIRICLGML